MKIPETGVEAAKVGGFLIRAGDKAHLDPVRHVDVIFYVDALDDFADWPPKRGAEIIDGARSVTAAGISPRATRTDLSSIIARR